MKKTYDELFDANLSENDLLLIDGIADTVASTYGGYPLKMTAKMKDALTLRITEVMVDSFMWGKTGAYDPK